VDLHRFVSDPDPIFHFDADPDRIRIQPQILQMWENQNREVTVLRCFIFLVSVIGAIIFCIFDSILNFSLHLVERDTATDPDRQALDADPYPDPAK
jgi:hypothetical protein